MLLALALTARAGAQTTWVVDMAGTGNFTTLHAAATSMQLMPGDTVQVVGRSDPITNLPIPYSEHVTEQFPIPLPPGIKVTSSPGTQAYFGSTGTTGALIHCVGAGSATYPTRIWNLWFSGGNPAISLDNTGSGEKWVDVRNCRFMGSRVGVSAEAKDGFTIHVQSTSCDLAPGLPASAYAPGYAVLSYPPEIGLKFHAVRSNPQGVDGHVRAAVNSLEMVGEFSTVGSRDWPYASYTLTPGNESHLRREVGYVSRAIEVFSTAQEHPVQPSMTDVELVLTACSLDGLGTATDSDSGWDIGVLALTESGNPHTSPAPVGFASSFDVTVIGSTIERFRHAGVVAVGSAYATGTMRLQGQTAVRRTGPVSHYAVPGFLGTGVYGCAYEGHLALFAEKSAISDNSGHGVMMESRASRIASFDGDVGAFLGLEQCKIHGNGGDGVSLYSHWDWNPGSDEWFVPNAGPRSVVGGTMREDPVLGTSFAAVDSAGVGAGAGPGYIRRCAISNNGGRGFFATAAGSSTPQPAIGQHAVSLAVVNCAIWNNPLGGYLLLGDCGDNQPGGNLGPYLMAPLVHCTLAGNGSTAVDSWTGQPADYSVEVFEAVNSTQLDNLYRWDDPTGVMYSTRINNDILQRANPNDPDLGPTLNLSHGIADQSNPGPLSATSVPVEGLRAQGVNFSLSYLNLDSAPWNTINLASRDETQFILLNSGSSGGFSITPLFLHAAVADSVIDFFAQVRDPLSSMTREKGYDELP